MFFSHYFTAYYDENGTTAINFEDFIDVNYFIAGDSPLAFKNNRDHVKPSETNAFASRKVATAFCLQMICYLSSKELDVVEDKVTKATYKPSTTVKNKFSEIKRYDVGVRYGSAIRATIKKHEEREKREYHNSGGKRYPTRPHFQCAHWQRYCVGARTTECITKWIAPTFVGYIIEEKDKRVVIHKVS